MSLNIRKLVQTAFLTPIVFLGSEALPKANLYADTADLPTSELTSGNNTDLEFEQDISRPLTAPAFERKKFFTVKNIGTIFAITYLAVLAMDKKIRKDRPSEVNHFESEFLDEKPTLPLLLAFPVLKHPQV